MAAASSLLASAFASGLRPEPALLVSEWADRYRVVGKPSPEPGLWRTDRVPYTREIMDALSPASPVEIVVLMKAAQGAGTEIAMNALGCWMDRYPDSAMWVQPTVNTAKKFVRTRLDTFIGVNPRLRDLIAPAKSRSGSNSASLKTYGAGETLVICGANSGPDLRSYPSRYAVMDEVDGYPPDLDGEGDPTELVIQRTAGYRGRKICMLSTPTIEETSIIVRWHKRGDQRLFYVACPFCRQMQPLVWFAGEEKLGGLKWPKGEPHLAKYECAHCGDRFEEWRKVEMLQRGEWEPTAPGVGGGKIRSYQINALYYPYGWPGNAWVNLAAAWEADHRDPLRLKSFVNLKLGQAWADPSEAKADADSLMARREAYGPEIPGAAAVLTAGCDVQANRLECSVWAWGRDEESWLVEHRVFLGDTSKAPVWAELDGYLRSEFLSELNLPMSISATCVDAGYQTQVVTQWTGERFNRKVWATFGRPGKLPTWPKKPGRSRTTKTPTFVIGVDSAKEIIYARLRVAEPGPGFVHFHGALDRDYFEQLTSEVRLPDYSGPIPKFVWKKKIQGARNETLDCAVTAYAALCGLQAGFLRLNAEVTRFQRMAEQAAARPVAVAASAAVSHPMPAPQIHMAPPKSIVPNDPYL